MYQIRQLKTPIIPPTGKFSSRYPFAEMNPGDFFELPNLDRNPPDMLRDSAMTIVNMRNHVSRWNRNHPGVKFYCTIKKDNPNFITVWRES